MSEIITTTLEEQEKIIERGLEVFIDVGNALADIRDRRLYREQYGTFEEYCLERWGMSRPRVYQLISAAKVIDNLSTAVDKNQAQFASDLLTQDNPHPDLIQERIDNLSTIVDKNNLPQTESQARPLTKLPADEQATVWQKAVETAPDGKVTAKHVEKVVTTHIEKSTPFPMKNYQATIYKPHPQDCCQTPPHALKPLYSFINTNQTIWEPAAGEGYLAKDMEVKGFNVIASDILTQQNFFDFEPPNWDVLITNPPYHSGVLGQWIERCYSFGKPFALLMKLTTLGTKYGFEPFSKYGVELIIFDQRINFKMPNKGWDGSGAQFAACWFTWKLGLGQQITFMELEPDEKTT